jgi:hypothetical protein
MKGLALQPHAFLLSVLDMSNQPNAAAAPKYPHIDSQHIHRLFTQRALTVWSPKWGSIFFL